MSVFAADCIMSALSELIMVHNVLKRSMLSMACLSNVFGHEQIFPVVNTGEFLPVNVTTVNSAIM